MIVRAVEFQRKKSETGGEGETKIAPFKHES
jgi:hypothetical protein